MSRFLTRLLAPLVPALAAAVVALPAHAQKAPTRYVAATDATVTSYTEDSQGGRPGHVIWVTNASTVPIVVFGVTLSDCENIKGYCGNSKVKIRIGPGSRSIVKRVDADDIDKGFRYRSGFSWRPDSSDIAALKTLASAGDDNAQRQLEQRAEASAARGATVGNPNYQLDQDAIVAIGDRIHALRVEPDSIVLPAERFFVVGDVRVFALDAEGQVLGRVRAFNWRVPRTAVQIVADTVVGQAPGRVKLEFLLVAPAPPVAGEMTVIVVPASK